MEEFRNISLKSILASILRRIWLVILIAVVFGLAAFFITKFAITPQYQATIRLYVNNKTEASNSLTQSDVTAAKSLVNTYITIIQSNSVIDNVANSSGINYTNEEIRAMLSAKSINGTEVFEVSITGPSPEDCARIANRIAMLAPDKISRIIDGSSVKIIDDAKVPEKPISPSVTRNVFIAVMLGLVLSCIAVVIAHIWDTNIYTEEDIKEFCTLPILGVFPNLNKVDQDSYGYVYSSRGRDNE